MKRTWLLLLFVLILLSNSVFAQDKPAATPADQGASKPAASDEEQTASLAKAAQNPIASMISVPLQNNTAFGVGPYDRDQNVLNIQPVIPVRISENWNLINRIIQPIVWQPNVQQSSQGWFGLGDMNPTFFLSPAKPHKLIWGVGPTFVIPTATADQLGQGKFSLGPAVVLLTTPGHWVIGTLINNVWSVAGSGSRPPVNQMLFQYFINYNMKKGWYLVTSPINTADWRASSGNQWTVPLGGGVGRIMRLGLPAGQYHSAVIRQRGASGGDFPVGHADANSIPVPEEVSARRIVKYGIAYELSCCGCLGKVENATHRYIRPVFTVREFIRAQRPEIRRLSTQPRRCPDAVDADSTGKPRH